MRGKLWVIVLTLSLGVNARMELPQDEEVRFGKSAFLGKLGPSTGDP